MIAKIVEFLMKIFIIDKDRLDERLFELNMMALARKFRWNVAPDHISNFTRDMRKFIWEFKDEELEGYDILLYDEFKKLFDAKDSGNIKNYKLPDCKFFVTKKYHEDILADSSRGEYHN